MSDVCTHGVPLRFRCMDCEGWTDMSTDTDDGPDLSERVDPRDVAAARSAGRIRAWKEVDFRGDDEGDDHDD